MTGMSSSIKRVKWAILLLFLIFAVGAVGYSLLEGWNLLDSLWMPGSGGWIETGIIGIPQGKDTLQVVFFKAAD